MPEEKTLKEKLLQLAVQVKEITGKTDYYEFVHKVLPKFFFEGRKYFKEACKSSECPLELMITAFCEVFAKDFGEFFPPFSWFGDVTEDIKAFILEMPEPRKAGEPYFVAFVFHSEKESFKPRYFVLEKRFQSLPEDPPFVLCEKREAEEYKIYREVKIKKLTIKDLRKEIKKVIEK
jgi:hypothetical protein